MAAEPFLQIEYSDKSLDDGARVFCHNLNYFEARQRETTSGIHLKAKSTSVMFGHSSPELLLSKKAEQVCVLDEIDYKGLMPVQRLFLTHFRCPMCKLLPLYCLNLSHPKKVRCGRCSNLVSFTTSGKYGKMRKRIAFELWASKKVRVHVQ